MLKRLALTIAIAGSSGAALAADLRGPIIEAPPPLPAPAAGFNWTGAYAGINVGVGTASPTYSYSASVPSTPGYINNYGCNNPVLNPDGSVSCSTPVAGSNGFSNSGSQRFRSGGVLGGVQVGYNYALGGAFGRSYGNGFGFGIGAVPVIGVEADFDGSGISSGAALGDVASGALTGTSAFAGVTSHLQYFGTVRGRLGMAFDRLLVFGTGGFAYGETDNTLSSPSNGIYNHASNFHTGFAYGGGFEYALTNNLLLRAEYLHLDLNSKAVVANGVTSGFAYSLYEKPSLDLVRAGLSYKFDFARPISAPVIARY